MCIYDKFCALCDSKNEKPSRAAINAGISKSLLTRWKDNPEVMPNGETLLKIANYFSVSVDDLMDEKETPAGEGERVYSPALQKIVDELYGMTDEQLDKLLLLIRSAKKVL